MYKSSWVSRNTNTHSVSLPEILHCFYLCSFSNAVYSPRKNSFPHGFCIQIGSRQPFDSTQRTHTHTHTQNDQTTQVHKSCGFSSTAWHIRKSSEVHITSAFPQYCECNSPSGTYLGRIGCVWREAGGCFLWVVISSLSVLKNEDCFSGPLDVHILTMNSVALSKTIRFFEGGQELQFSHPLFHSTPLHYYDH